VIADRVSGPGLAAHVTTAMRAALDDGCWACDTHEPQWLAPAYQWTLLLEELRAWDRDNPGSGAHPRTRELEVLYCRNVPGSTCAGQAAAVQRWHDAAQRDPRILYGVAFGTRSPDAVGQAIGARPSDPDWKDRLAGDLADFPDSGWVHDLLCQVAAEVPP
jgi:hypothetical protein